MMLGCSHLLLLSYSCMVPLALTTLIDSDLSSEFVRPELIRMI